MAIKATEISDLIKAAHRELQVRHRGAQRRHRSCRSPTASCRIHGLADARYGEMLEFPGNTFGLALNLEQDSVGAVVLGEYKHLSEGDTVKTTGRILEVPVGPELLGRVVDALGTPIDGKGPVKAKRTVADRARGARASSTASRSASRCRPATRRSTPWCRSAAASAS